MSERGISRRLLGAAAVAAIAASTVASAQQEIEPMAWARDTAARWAEILGVPVELLSRGALPAYRVARNDAELAQARARAAARRARLEAEVTRCRALVDAAGPAPALGEAWAQAIADAVPADQRHALDRLAALAPFLELIGVDYVRGARPFTAVSRMTIWSLFAETDWIMAVAGKVDALGRERDSLEDLMLRTVALDGLVQSTLRGVLVRIVYGDPPDHIAPAQSILGASATEMRRIATLLTFDNLRLRVGGELRERLHAGLPRLRRLAEEHAQRIEATAQGWPALTADQLLASDSAHDEWPSFVVVAAPILEVPSAPT